MFSKDSNIKGWLLAASKSKSCHKIYIFDRILCVLFVKTSWMRMKMSEWDKDNKNILYCIFDCDVWPTSSEHRLTTLPVTSSMTDKLKL